MKRLVCILLLAGSVACRDNATEHAEQKSRMAENEALREQVKQAEQEHASTRERLMVTQMALNDVETEFSRMKVSHDTLQKNVREHTLENADLRKQLALATERLRVIDEAAEETRLLEERKAQEEFAAAAVAGPPPFQVFDVMYVGEMDFEGKKRNVGHFSVTNNTDAALRIFANSLFRTTRIDIAPHSASNGIHMAAKQGDQLRVSVSNHVETVTW